MNLQDYLNASVCEKEKIDEYDEECLKNNWLNRNTKLDEWTMTAKYVLPYEEEGETITPENNTIYSVGNTITDSIISTELNVRPIVYLNSRILLTSGNGTLDNPYIIR